MFLFPISCSTSNGVNLKSDQKVLEIDNTMVHQQLLISDPSESVVLEYKGDNGTVRESLFFEKGETQICLNISALLNLIPPGSKAKLILDSKKIIQIERKSLIPLGHRSLERLYHQIAEDLKKNKSFQATIVVVLWDASFTGEGFFGLGKKRSWADGNNPEGNLYWGAATGIYTLLKHFGWQVKKEEVQDKSPLREANFSKKFKPSEFWKKLGVKDSFEVKIVLKAYKDSDIVLGYEEFVKELKNEENRVVGLHAHYVSEGKKALKGIVAPKLPKGIFIVSCYSGPEFGPLILRNNLYPLLLSIPTTTGEGYVGLPVVEGIIEGDSLSGILKRVYQYYHKYQGKSPGFNQYINPIAPNFERVLLDGNDDWDGDNVPNLSDFDPIDSRQ